MSNNQIRGCRTSAIELAAKCPYACQKIYRDGVVGGNNTLALLGTALHNVLEEYGQHCLLYKVETDFDFYATIIDKHVISLPEEVQEDAREVIEKLRDRVEFGSALKADDARIERRFFLDENLNVLPDDSKDFYFTSAIDLYFIIDGIAYIFDYKSSRSVFSPTMMEHKLQKDFYSYMVMAAHPEVNETAFAFDFIRYGYRTKPIAFNRTEDFEPLKRKLLAGCENYYKLMGVRDDGDPRPSGFCGLCEVRGICPAVNNALCNLANITSTADAITAARKLKALKIATEQVTASLKEWVNAHGNIPISVSEQFGIIAGEKSEVDAKLDLLRALQAANVPSGAISDILTIAKGKAEKLIKKMAPEVDLSKFTKKKATTSFKYMDLEHDSGESTEADS